MLNVLFLKIKNNAYWYFFLKLFILIIIIGFLDFTMGSTLRYYYFKQTSGLQYRTTYAIEKTTADILIFGSSRANHHYRPEIFEKRLNLSYYNVGRDGNYIFYYYAVLKAILKRYSPRAVILDLRSGEFNSNHDSYDVLQSLLPYYRKHPEMRSVIELKSPYEKIKLLSNIYPFNSSIFTIAPGNSKFNQKRFEEIEGYIPLRKNWSEPLRTAESTWTIYNVDSTKVRIYDAFINDCINANIKLYIVCSPYFVKSLTPDYSLIKAKEIANKHNVPFFDFSGDSTFFANAALFADESHLNDEGAKKFSNLLVDKILMMGKLN
jgi:hypothetical protein